ncbi:hypothetical protein XJ20_04475 [Serratia liquefaciens]|nr:hypothetical protein XJ20_04475 [Serratia liquefaciens]
MDGNLIEQNSSTPHNPFDGGNGGGGDDMTERLERLEKRVDSIESVLTRLSDSMIRIEGKFDVIGMKFDNFDKRFDSTSKVLTDKIDSSVKLNESSTRAMVAEAKLAIILAIPAIIGAAYTAYRLLSRQ